MFASTSAPSVVSSTVSGTVGKPASFQSLNVYGSAETSVGDNNLTAQVEENQATSNEIAATSAVETVGVPCASAFQG